MIGSRSILLFAPAAYPLGGLATWLDYLVPGLEERGWQVQVGLTCGDHHDASAYRSRHPRLAPVQIRNRTGSREGRVRSLARTVGELRPAIVAGVNIADTYCAVERVVAAGNHTPRAVMTLHGLQADLLEDAATYSASLAGVICSNRLACRLIEKEAGLDPRRVQYAPYGPPLRALERDRPPKEGVLRIAHVGRFDRFQKRVHDLPAIAQQLADRDIAFELLLAGDGPEREWLESELEALVRAGKVTFLGPLAPPDLLSRVYLVADVLLLTSFWETGPLVVWEAMACGVTVVSSRFVGSGREGALRHDVNSLLFPIGDVEAAAECLEKAADASLRQRLATSASELVRERYTVERSIDAWDSAFATILEAPLPPAPAGSREIPEAGRLDRLLGTSRAEDVRRLLDIRFSHAAPGGEWPHSYGQRPLDDAAFWRLARHLDRDAG